MLVVVRCHLPDGSIEDWFMDHCPKGAERRYCCPDCVELECMDSREWLDDVLGEYSDEDEALDTPDSEGSWAEDE